MNNNVLSITQINYYLKSYIDENPKLKSLYVKGEISDFKGSYASGHLYFSLKDLDSEIRCVMFKSYADRLRFIPENGIKVIVRCDLNIYQKNGSSQLCIYDMEPEGIGAKYIAFNKLKEKLQKEGLFASEHKKAIPKYPNAVGIVTSAQGAAIHDIENVISRRWPLCKVILSPSAVQGESACIELKNALLKLENSKKADVIIITRGGGSSEDLDAFNDEELARTIYRCNTPIVSAVGHEIDYTICDFVADLRAPTPSAAAELVVPNSEEIIQDLDSNLDWLRNTINKKISNLQNNLINIQSLRNKNLEYNKINNFLSKVEILRKELLLIKNNYFNNYSNRINEELYKLDTNNPSKLLTKSLCIVEKEKVKIKSINDIQLNDIVTLNFKDGKANALINNIQKY